MNLKKIDYVMVMVENMGRSVEFYRDVLGLPLKFTSPGWTEFATGATTLALHGGATASNKDAKTPHSDKAGECSIGFSVENLQDTFETLKSKGVTFRMPPTDRKDEGIMLAVAVDPDGLEISFAQTVQRK